MDDDLKAEVQEKLAGTKRTRRQAGNMHSGEDGFDENTDKPIFKVHDEEKFKERNRAEQRNKALKASYEKDHKAVMLKKYAKSSFLTPEAAMYLNEAMKKNQSKVDQEIVYAGLHNAKLEQKKFKRANKNQQRFKNRTKRS